jgi:RNA polymerase sigma-70 factor (ECF subfamily)
MQGMVYVVAASEAAKPTEEDLARLYAARVHRFAAMVCRNRADSEDLAQDALVKAMRSLPSFDPERGSIESWLWRIVVNLARSRGRAAGRWQALWERVAAREPRAVAEDTESLVLRRMSDASLLEHVRRLPGRSQTVLGLRFGADLGYEEMAALLGEQPAALRQAVRRALLRLRANLQEEL